MHAGDPGRRARGDVAGEHLERLGLERPFDDAKAVRPLGMALAHVVLEAGGMGDEKRGPVFGVLACDFRSPEIEPHVSRSLSESPFAITSESGLWIKPNLVLNEALAMSGCLSRALAGRRI